MSGQSDYLESASLNHVLTATPYTSPNATLHVALHIGDPLDSNAGATEVDVVVDDTAYARQPVTFGANAGGVSATTNTQTFGAVVYGSGAAPYTITHVGIYDALTAGNLLYSVAIVPQRTLSVGQIASFDTGAITITAD